MVRRAAAAQYKHFAESIVTNSYPNTEIEQVAITDGLSMLKMIIHDDQDSVRLQTLKPLATMLELTIKKNLQTSTQALFDFYVKLAEDQSWRVRREVASTFGSLPAKFVKANPEHNLLHIFLQLLKDPEAEVRIRISENIGDYCNQINESSRRTVVLDTIFPVVKNYMQDASEQVKANFADNLMHIAKIVGKETSLNEIMPIALVLVKDDLSDVRQNIIKNLQGYDEVIGIEPLLTTVLPVIIELAKDAKPPKWRVRMTIIEIFPVLAEQLGKEVFNDKLTEIVLQCMNDNVCAIRDATCVAIMKISKKFGSEWLRVQVIAKLTDLSTNGCYLKRITALKLIAQLVTMKDSKVTAIVLPILSQLANDSVPNVKFNVALVYKKLQGQIPSADKSEVKKNLESL